MGDVLGTQAAPTRAASGCDLRDPGVVPGSQRFLYPRVMVRQRTIVVRAGLVVCLAACGDEPGTTDESEAVSFTQSGQAVEPMAGVELTCDSAGAGSVQCAWSDVSAGQELTLSIAFTTAYEQAAEGTVLALGTDFTITEFTYSIDGGLCCFAGSGPSVAIGELTIVLGARGDATAVTFDGPLSKASGIPGPAFAADFDRVPGTLP